MQFGQNCYEMRSRYMNFHDAMEDCARDNSVLASIHSPEENLFLIRQVSNSEFPV